MRKDRFANREIDCLDAEIHSRIESLLKCRVTNTNKVRAGYSAAQRWVVKSDSGQSFFVKIGTPSVSNQNLRDEAWVYECCKVDCMPKVMAWQDDKEFPIMLFEDLSVSHWPPPWKTDQIDQVLKTSKLIHSTRVPLMSYEEKHGPGEPGWWEIIETNPEPVLSLGLITEEWLKKSLPTLIISSESISLNSDRVIHFDLRSDNLCISDRGVIVVDWSLACLGNPRLDLGLFLPSLAYEGGPEPESILPNSPDVASWVCGFFAHHASKPFIPLAPRARELQLKQFKTSLTWVKRELDL